MLNKNSPLPLYHQLKTILEGQINSGEWPPETRVPSERELCQTFSISRITVRQAIAELVIEGRLVRMQGLGTFVASQRMEQRLTCLTSFTEDMRSRGKQPGARVLRVESCHPTPAVARSLQLESGEQVIQLERLRFADEEPMAIETAQLPARLCPGLMDEDLGGRSLYELLAAKYGIYLARAEQQLAALACPPAKARILAIRKGAPVLQILRLTFDSSDRPFEHTESFYRGDRYVFHAELANKALLRPTTKQLFSGMEY